VEASREDVEDLIARSVRKIRSFPEEEQQKAIAELKKREGVFYTLILLYLEIDRLENK
jgi:hypothetical protein